MLVKDIYNSNIFPIKDTLSVKEALKFLVNKNCNGVLVINAQGELTGVFSLQDIVAAIVPNGMKENANLASAMYTDEFFEEICAETKNKQVKDIMRKNFSTVLLNSNILELGSELLRRDPYIIPVIENGKPIGIITRSEIKTALAREMGIPLQ